MSLKKLFKGLGYYFHAFFILLRQKKYLKNSFLKDMEFPSNLEKEYYFNSKFYNRTKQYMLANQFYGELLCILRGRKMDKIEIKRFAALSACAPIFDDFFDKKSDDLDKIRNLLNNPDNELPESELQKLALHFLNNILTEINNQDEFLINANLLFEAQKASEYYQRKEGKCNQLWHYSQQKGGYSGLLYALLLENSLSELEKEIAFDLGAFGQLMDDVFDIYDDRLNQINTFPNNAKTLSEIEEFMESYLIKITEKIGNHSSSSGSKIDFINILQILASAIRVALAQYKRIEKEYKVAPKSCLKLDRKKWIVDMENPANLFKMFQISLSRIN